MAKKIIVILYLVIGCVLMINARTNPVTLNRTLQHVKIDYPGTVTFKFENDLHVKNARQEGLRNISGLTFNAAVIYSIGFNKNQVSTNGKIFNYTDKAITAHCNYYSGSRLIASYTITVKPRTFNRMIPDDAPMDKIKECDRVVCYED